MVVGGRDATGVKGVCVCVCVCDSAGKSLSALSGAGARAVAHFVIITVIITPQKCCTSFSLQVNISTGLILLMLDELSL